MSRFLVTWRSRLTQRTYPVGTLIAGSGFEFSYLSNLELPEDFREFVNFPDLTQTYRSRALFPFFAQRLMDSRRSDYAPYVAALGLPPRATELDVLGRAGGRRKGDTVEVVAEPDVSDTGAVDHLFLVRGISHLPGSDAALQQVSIDAQMQVVAQLDNQVNPEALQVGAPDGQSVGWVPDALLHLAHKVIERDYQLIVHRLNGPDWPSHMRLVVRLLGNVPPGFEPFGPVMSNQRAVTTSG
jgi:hypothetical protein